MHCAIMAIGDELTTGAVVDENSAWISDKLVGLGARTVLHLTVDDDLERIVDAFHLAGERARTVIVTGGLGPTEDDLTRDAFCKFAGVGTVENTEAIEQMKNIFKAIGREMSENNRRQAHIPQGSAIIPNPVGTAPGFFMEVKGTTYYFLPGVPRECKIMMEASVLPALAKNADNKVFRIKVYRTFGMTESQLDQELLEVRMPPGVRLGFRAVFPEIQLKLMAEAGDETAADQAIVAAGEAVVKKVGQAIYSDDGRSLEQVVLDEYREAGKKIALAESCTGGLVAKRITDVPGSSDVLERGFVTYSNQSKIDLLGVPPEVIEKFGAVSDECVLAMAAGALERSSANVALAISGVAGPTGGTRDKPVGTVFMALADEEGTWSRRFNFLRPDRNWVRELTAQAALEILRRRILGLGEYIRWEDNKVTTRNNHGR